MPDAGRTVLLVTYEFPPTGGAGVQRVAKFARYLPRYGWRAEVLSAELVPGRPIDESLAEEVADVRVRRTPARHIGQWVTRTLAFARSARAALGPAKGSAGAGGAKVRTVSPGKAGRTEQITRFLGIPDHAMLWIGPAVRAGVRLGREAGVSAVVASAPPFSALVAGERIARRLGVPFVADFRDAWRDNPALERFPTPFHQRRSLELEREVLSNAAAVVTAHPMRDEVVGLGGVEPVLLPNGFDPEDVPVWAPASDNDLVMAFVGTLYGVNDPWPVLEALRLLRERKVKVRFRIIGTWPSHVEDNVAVMGLEGVVEFRPYMPHREALAALSACDLGVIIYANSERLRSSTPGKLYEYLGIGIPVMFVGPTDGVAPDLVREAGAGVVVPYTDPAAIADAIARFAELKATGTRPSASKRQVVEHYSRPAQAGVLAGVLDEVTRR